MTDLQTKKGNAAPEGWAEAVFEVGEKLDELRGLEFV